MCGRLKKQHIDPTINSDCLAIHRPFTSKISVKREHGTLITVMCYFYFLKSVKRA